MHPSPENMQEGVYQNLPFLPKYAAAKVIKKYKIYFMSFRNPSISGPM